MEVCLSEHCDVIRVPICKHVIKMIRSHLSPLNQAVITVCYFVYVLTYYPVKFVNRRGHVIRGHVIRKARLKNDHDK